MVTAGATANTTEENSRASRESGSVCSHSHGESIGFLTSSEMSVSPRVDPNAPPPEIATSEMSSNPPVLVACRATLHTSWRDAVGRRELWR